MNSTRPTVAVIIPTYNRAALLKQALESVLRQTRPADDVVVVDDGSSDATAAVVRRFQRQVRYVHQANAGKPAALNRGLRTITSDYVWIMDDDDVALPDAIERHLRYRGAHPEVDFTYSGVWCFEGLRPPPSVESCHLWQRTAIPHAEFFIRALEEFPCNQQTMLVPASCYSAVGPFDEKQTFVEDYDMVLRLARHFRAGLIEMPTILLRQHTGERGPARERHAAADRWSAWRPYERRLFASIRATLPLAEYLPRGTVSGEMDRPQRRRALLQRACVMSRHGLFPEALADLRAAVAEFEAGAPLSRQERRICGQMLNVEPGLLAGRTAFLRQASELLRGPAPDLYKAMGAGIGWSGAIELRAGHYLAATRMSGHLLRWFGPVGLAAMVGTKLSLKRSTTA